MSSPNRTSDEGAVLALITNTKAPAKKGLSKKRTLAMANGDEIDLEFENIPASEEVVNAMRLRILELEDQLAAPKPKRARKSDSSATTLVAGDGDGESSSKAAPSVTLTKDEKKVKAQLKKIFDRMKKVAKADDFKFQGSSKLIKIEEIFSKEEFDQVFKGKGVLIQPTPENKPTSTVTIIRFTNKEDIDALFGADSKLSGFRWTKGGIFGGGFTKSVKVGPCKVNIDCLEVNYSRNGMKCKLTFDVSEEF